jgi:hypothetical protein
MISRMAGPLQGDPLVRLVRRAIVALTLAACGPSEIEPRTPVNAQFIDPTYVDAPAIEDSFPEVLAKSQTQGSRRPERPPSISLGEIGDSPLGTEPTPPHHLADWEQPFPCDWTNTCYVPFVSWRASVQERALPVAP